MSMRSSICFLCATILLPCLTAQTPTGGLVGDIRDASGARLPAAQVAARNRTTSEIRNATANTQGEYTVPNLTPGVYDVEVKAAGFRGMKQTGIELQVNQTARIDFTLEVGTVSESIEVSTQAPVLNTETSVKGDVVVNTEIMNMPLNGRDFLELGLLVPGVEEKPEGTWQGSTMAVNGARPDNTNFVVDGFNNQNHRGGQPQAHPPIDAMLEFKVETSGYSAEFGRLAGGVVNMALKTGGNQLHGALFEFMRNNVVDARNFFAGDEQKLRQNQFGATLSGPVWIPKVYNGKNRTFFVFSWESYRQSQGIVNLMVVPTDLERNGDFSKSVNTSGKTFALKDPFAAGNFPGNVIPASRFQSAAAVLRDYYPSPNLAGANNYRAYAINQSVWDSFLYKVDHRLSDKDSVSARFTHRLDSGHQPFYSSDLPTFGGEYPIGTMLGGITYTRTFTPTLINEFRAGFSRETERSRMDDFGQNLAAKLGITGVTTDPALAGLPKITINGLPQLGDADQPPHQLAVNSIEAADTVTWVKGRHALKFGGSVLRGQVLQAYNKNVRGTLTFNGKVTNASFGDFLLGLPDSTSRATSPTPIYVFNTNLGGFVQDDYRIRPNLTLNIGLRYEYAAPMSEKYDRFAGFVPAIGKLIIADDRTIPNLAAMIQRAGLDGRVGLARDFGLPHTLANANKKNFAPRFGFAWRPFGGSKFVVRSAYGVFYASSANDPIRLDLGNVFPFAANETYNRDTKNPGLLTLANPFPEVISKISGVNDVFGQELNPASQYLQCWNFTVEREVIPGTALEVGYTGSKGTHLGSLTNINTPNRKPGLQLPDGSYPRPYPQFNNIQMFGYNTNSSYNAGTVTLRRRFASGFFYRVNYTFGKSIDYNSQISGNGSGGGAVLDPRNRRFDRGRSSWDVRHSFTTTFSYEVPKSAGKILGRWQLAGSGRMSSGRPFTPAQSGVNTSLGEGDRPDRIANGSLDNPSADRWFDTSAFPVVPAGSLRFGTAGRNILDGPGLISLNLALMKNFPLWEHGRLQFRVEAFNATNHSNFMLPNRTVNLVNGGVVSSAGPARIFQAALRYSF